MKGIKLAILATSLFAFSLQATDVFAHNTNGKPITGPVTTPVTSPLTSPMCKPGWGFGDRDHDKDDCHFGPPGHHENFGKFLSDDIHHIFKEIHFPFHFHF